MPTNKPYSDPSGGGHLLEVPPLGDPDEHGVPAESPARGRPRGPWLPYGCVPTYQLLSPDILLLTSAQSVYPSPPAQSLLLPLRLPLLPEQLVSEAQIPNRPS